VKVERAAQVDVLDMSGGDSPELLGRDRLAPANFNVLQGSSHVGATAVHNLAIAFEHYNEQHPHSALKYRSPREFRRAMARERI